MVQILLIKGEPVFHLVAIAGDHLLAVADKSVHHPAVGKTVVALRQRQRHIEVVQADHRLNAAGDQFIYKLMVEGDPFSLNFAHHQADAAPAIWKNDSSSCPDPASNRNLLDNDDKSRSPPSSRANPPVDGYHTPTSRTCHHAGRRPTPRSLSFVCMRMETEFPIKIY